MNVLNTDTSFTVNIPATNPEKVKRAYNFLSNEYVEDTTEHFIISTETIDSMDMKDYAAILMDQHKELAQNNDFRRYIERLRFNQGGEQFIKAIETGQENTMSMSVIACKRVGNQVKILFATLEKKVKIQDAMSRQNFTDRFWSLFGYKPKLQSEIEKHVSDINMEDSKRCMEALAYHLVGKSIRDLMGTNVNINFVPITNPSETETSI